MMARFRRTHTCVPSSCLNGGRCLTTSEGLAYCICSRGFMGARCEKAIESCADRPCDFLGFGGQCVEEEVEGILGSWVAVVSPATSPRPKYRCQCAPGYQGENCDSCSEGYYKLLFVCITADEAKQAEAEATASGGVLNQRRGWRVVAGGVGVVTA